MKCDTIGCKKERQTRDAYDLCQDCSLEFNIYSDIAGFKWRTWEDFVNRYVTESVDVWK